MFGKPGCTGVVVIVDFLLFIVRIIIALGFLGDVFGSRGYVCAWFALRGDVREAAVIEGFPARVSNR